MKITEELTEVSKQTAMKKAKGKIDDYLTQRLDGLRDKIETAVRRGELSHEDLKLLSDTTNRFYKSIYNPDLEKNGGKRLSVNIYTVADISIQEPIPKTVLPWLKGFWDSAAEIFKIGYKEDGLQEILAYLDGSVTEQNTNAILNKFFDTNEGIASQGRLEEDTDYQKRIRALANNKVYELLGNVLALASNFKSWLDNSTTKKLEGLEEKLETAASFTIDNVEVGALSSKLIAIKDQINTSGCSTMAIGGCFDLDNLYASLAGRREHLKSIGEDVSGLLTSMLISPEEADQEQSGVTLRKLKDLLKPISSTVDSVIGKRTPINAKLTTRLADSEAELATTRQKLKAVEEKEKSTKTELDKLEQEYGASRLINKGLKETIVENKEKYEAEKIAIEQKHKKEIAELKKKGKSTNWFGSVLKYAAVGLSSAILVLGAYKITHPEPRTPYQKPKQKLERTEEIQRPKIIQESRLEQTLQRENNVLRQSIRQTEQELAQTNIEKEEYEEKAHKAEQRLQETKQETDILKDDLKEKTHKISRLEHINKLSSKTLEQRASESKELRAELDGAYKIIKNWKDAYRALSIYSSHNEEKLKKVTAKIHKPLDKTELTPKKSPYERFSQISHLPKKESETPKLLKKLIKEGLQDSKSLRKKQPQQEDYKKPEPQKQPAIVVPEYNDVGIITDQKLASKGLTSARLDETGKSAVGVVENVYKTVEGVGKTIFGGVKNLFSKKKKDKEFKQGLEQTVKSLEGVTENIRSVAWQTASHPVDTAVVPITKVFNVDGEKLEQEVSNAFNKFFNEIPVL